MSSAPVVIVDTTMGSFEITLDPATTPKTVDNFLAYVDAKHYDGTIFHRVISNFMVQGGGYDASFEKKPTRAPVENEAHASPKNTRGTVAMARTSEPNSATCQFFVNVADNGFLDHQSKEPSGYGYAVFGRVSKGMDVVDRIKSVRTGANGPFGKDAPIETVTIRSIRRA